MAAPHDDDNGLDCFGDTVFPGKIGTVTPARPILHSLSACAECGATGDEFTSANVEAFELTGDLICDDCADTVLERLAEEESE